MLQRRQQCRSAFTPSLSRAPLVSVSSIHPLDPHDPSNPTLQVQKFLGKGSFGSAYRVMRHSDGKVYAVKETDVSLLTTEARQDAINEIRLLASVSHENVIRYYESFLDGNWLCIIMEYADSGDLSYYIKKAASVRHSFPETIIWDYFTQILLGVQVRWAARGRGLLQYCCGPCSPRTHCWQALHDKKILHRDIKPMNIFVGEGGVVKVGDLGIAKTLKDGDAKTQIGTPLYMAPEIWEHRSYSYEADMWSLGVVLYEMMMLKAR